VAKLISVHASSGNEGNGTSEQTSEGDPGLTCSEQLDHPDDLDDLVKDDDGAEPGFQDAAIDHDLSHDGEMVSEGESLPAPEYSDLLDTAWLSRDFGTTDLDGNVVDEVGVVLDLGDFADDDDAATALEFDVGSLLTPLAPESFGPGAQQALDSAHAESVLPDSFTGSLLPVSLLPQETAATDRGDDEVGDDERFPVFEPEHDATVSREDDAASDVERD
jgi:hypothetical protein